MEFFCCCFFFFCDLLCIAELRDALTFGKATCASCPHQDKCQLKYVDGTALYNSHFLNVFLLGLYECKTELQWGKCGYSGTNVKIHPWKTAQDPPYAFLKKLGPPLERPLKKVNRKKLKVYTRDSKQPLAGAFDFCRFFLCLI